MYTYMPEVQWICFVTGVVPQFCEAIFQGIDSKKSSGENAEYEVTFSMLEIYNEQVRDLLTSKPPLKGGLKVRQHPSKGFLGDWTGCLYNILLYNWCELHPDTAIMVDWA